MVIDLLQDDVADVAAAADAILETAIREEPSFAEGIRTLRFEACNAEWLALHESTSRPAVLNEVADESDDLEDSPLL